MMSYTYEILDLLGRVIGLSSKSFDTEREASYQAEIHCQRCKKLYDLDYTFRIRYELFGL